MNKLLSLAILFTLSALSVAQSQSTELLQLKKYIFDSEVERSMTENFLRDTYLPILRKVGMERIGVFKNHSEDGDTIISLYLLIPVNGFMDIHDIDEALLAEFPTEKHYARVENIFLKSFIDMPKLVPSELEGIRSKRIYELRSYESANDRKFKNKVEMFNAGGEVTLFEDLGFNAVFYAEVVAGAAMPNLMYMTTHKNQAARDKNWAAFRVSPVWKKLSSQEKYQDNVSHIDIFYLYPTQYSDY